MTVDEIRNTIRNSEATAADLRQADAAADALINGFDRDVDALEVQRQDLLLEPEGAAKLKKVDEQIRALNLQSEICIAAKAKLAVLIKDADARELDADLKAKGRRTAEIAKDLTEQMLRWDEAQAVVGEAAACIRELTDELGALRNLLVQHGRRDLVAVNPYARLQDLGVQPVHMPDFRAPVPTGYAPPANNRISRPLLRLREVIAEAGTAPADSSSRPATMLQRAGQLLTSSMPSLGGAGAKTAPTNVTERASA